MIYFYLMKDLPLLENITTSCNFTQKKKNTQPTKGRKQLELNKTKSEILLNY